MRERILRKAGVTVDVLGELTCSLSQARDALLDLEGNYPAAHPLPPAVLEQRSLMNAKLLRLVDQVSPRIEAALTSYRGRTVERDGVVMLLPYCQAKKDADDITLFVSECRELVVSIENYATAQKRLELRFLGPQGT